MSPVRCGRNSQRRERYLLKVVMVLIFNKQMVMEKERNRNEGTSILKVLQNHEVQIQWLMDALTVTLDTFLLAEITFTWSCFSQGIYLMKTPQQSQMWSCNNTVGGSSIALIERIKDISCPSSSHWYACVLCIQTVNKCSCFKTNIWTLNITQTYQKFNAITCVYWHFRS